MTEPVTLLLPDDLTIDGLPTNLRVLPYRPDHQLPSGATEAAGLVLWGASSSWIAEVATQLTDLRWVQTLAAGAEDVLQAGFHDAVICNGSGLHDHPVAEHALALILCAARRLDVHLVNQKNRHWSDLGGRQADGNRHAFTTLSGAKVAIWGFGGIGQRLASHLRMLGSDVVGVATSSGTRAGFTVLDASGLPPLLPALDLLVTTLPLTHKTRGMINRDVLDALSSTAWLVNVGRGPVVDQDALVDALTTGGIGGAALDVTDPEPLPQDSPLWGLPNLILTPHAAGGRPRGAGELIRHNVEAWLGDGDYQNRVDQ